MVDLMWVVIPFGGDDPRCLCARHGRRLGGGSPLYAWQRGVLAKDKGVRCEAESEGSRRQSPDLTNRNRI